MRLKEVLFSSGLINQRIPLGLSFLKMAAEAVSAVLPNGGKVDGERFLGVAWLDFGDAALGVDLPSSSLLDEELLDELPEIR